MTKRMFNLDELKVSQKNLLFLNEEIEYKEKVILPRIQLTLDTADIVIKKQIKEEKIKKKTVTQEIEEYKKSVEILQDQIENGVEEKEITETEGQ